MNTHDTELKELVKIETKKIKKKRPTVNLIDLSQEENSNGSYTSKLKVKVKNKVVILENENRCPRVSIKKTFAKLARVLRMKKTRRVNRFNLNAMEVA